MLRQVGLQFTNRCHGQCIMCDNRLSKREHHEYFPIEKLDKVITEIEALGATGRHAATGVCGNGEAVYHPDFVDMIPIVARVPWSFGSNCDALTPELSSVILDNKPTVVSLSIDATTPEMLKRIRPGVKFDRAARNAIEFVAQTIGRESWDRDFFIQFVVMKLNVSELQEWVDSWLPLIEGIPGFKLHIKPVFRWPRVTAEMAESYYPSPSVDIAPHPQIQIDSMECPPVRPTCRLFWNFAGVMSDGSYNPCCMSGDDVWHVGNVFETSLEECYYSKKLNHYRGLLEQKKYDELPLCGKCK